MSFRCDVDSKARIEEAPANRKDRLTTLNALDTNAGLSGPQEIATSIDE